MEQRERGRVRRVAQVGVEIGELQRDEETFVDEGARRERGDVQRREFRDARAALDLFAREDEPPLERVLPQRARDLRPAGDVRRTRDDRLLDVWCDAARVIAQRVQIDGHRAPGEQRQVVLDQRGLDDLLCLHARGDVRAR